MSSCIPDIFEIRWWNIFTSEDFIDGGDLLGALLVLIVYRQLLVHHGEIVGRTLLLALLCISPPICFPCGEAGGREGSVVPDFQIL